MEWVDAVVVEADRRKQAFLLDWRGELAAVEAYGQVPVHPHRAVEIAPEYVVARLGPALTAMAREARRLERHARGVVRRVRDNPLDPALHDAANQAWGARQALAVGVGVHCGLSHEQAQWLAEALSGYVPEYLARTRARLAQQDQDPQQ